MKKFILVVLLLIPALILTACYKKNKSDATAVTIKQVLGNPANSIQSNALYLFNDNKLNVLITFSPFQNPTKEPSDSEFKKTYQNDLKEFNKTFPNNKLTEEDYHSDFEKEFKRVTLKINETTKEVTLSSKDVEKTFKMSDSNKNRLIDNLGNEYELVIDEE